MSLCFRTFPNKLASFASTRKQVTKIDYGLPKHVKPSSFLEEFLVGRTTGNATDVKDRALTLATPYFPSPNLPLASHNTYSRQSDLAARTNDRSQKRTMQTQHFMLMKTERLSLINPKIPNDIVMEKKDIDTCTDAMKIDANIYNVNPILNACMDDTRMFSKASHEKPSEMNDENENILHKNTKNTVSNSKQQNRDKPIPRKHRNPTEAQLNAIHEYLCRTLPRIFVEIMDYRMYTHDLIFINNIRGTNTTGIFPYIKQVQLLKIVGHLKYAYITFNILKITVHPEDNSVKVRWRIEGIGGMKIFSMLWNIKSLTLRPPASAHEAWYDGFSTFYVNGDGYIYKHVVDKIMLDHDCEKVKQPIATKLVALAPLIGLCMRYIDKFDSTSRSTVRLTKV